MNLLVLTLRNLKDGFLSRKFWSATVGAIALLLLTMLPALAHHPSGGKTPSTIVEGFLSGLGHPIIGLDHLAFVIASGLMAAAIGGGLLIPFAFVGSSLMGTGLHLMSIDLPLPELVISASVLAFGILLAMKNPPQNGLAISLATIAGIFHGFAYGESIFGAEMGPLLAYLLGFAVIQLAIAAVAYWVGKTLLSEVMQPTGLALRFAGFLICGVGATFLMTWVVDSLLPA